MFSWFKQLLATSQPLPDVHFTAFGCTDIGQKRTSNEDAFAIADLRRPNLELMNQVSSFGVGPAGGLLIVADGIGGAQGGGIASHLAVKSITNSLAAQPPAQPSNCLLEATRQANQAVRDYAAHNALGKGMGTTVTAAFIRGDVAHIAQVGDSRAYLIRGARIYQLTKDQTLAQYLHELTPHKPVNPQLGHVLMQALGPEAQVTAALTQVKLRQGDCLLLCSDGLSNKLSDGEIADTLNEVQDVSTAARWLVNQANQRGGEDNITVVIARFSGTGLPPRHEHTNSSSNSIPRLENIPLPV